MAYITTAPPKYVLGAWPTPLGRLKKTEELLGMGMAGNSLYIKRDDLNGLGAGGNKVRCLEYFVGQALADGCDTLIAAGPVQSNMCSLTAAAAAKAGLACILVFNGSKPEKLSGNQLLNSLLGCRMIFLGQVSPEERNAYTEKAAEQCRSSGGKPYIISNGGSNGVGALGYMSVVDELLEQYPQQPGKRMTLFVPGGNGGVAAGIIYGNLIRGCPFDIVVISVEDPCELLTEHIAGIIKDASDIYGADPGEDFFRCVRVTDAYSGGGWGVNTAESSAEVLKFARDEGIYVENIYTSKVIVGMKDMIRKGEVAGDACYIHTGGFGSLFSQY